MHPISIYVSHTHHEQCARLHSNTHPHEWQTASGSKCEGYRKRLTRRTARLSIIIIKIKKFPFHTPLQSFETNLKYVGHKEKEFHKVS